jgi:microcystin-dependent protein
MEAFIGTILPWPLNWAPEGWVLCNGQVLQVNQYQALYSLLGNTYGGTAPSTFAVPDMRGRVPLGMGVSQEGTTYPLAQKNGFETTTIGVANMPAHSHDASFTGTFSNGSISNGTISNGAISNGSISNGAISNGTISNGSCSVDVNLPNNAVNNVAGNSNTPGTNSVLAIAKTQGTSTNVNMYSTNTPNITLGDDSVTATGTVTGDVTGDVTGTVTGNVTGTVTGNVSGSVGGTVTVENSGGGQPVSNMQPYIVLNYIMCTNGIYPPKPN